MYSAIAGIAAEACVTTALLTLTRASPPQPAASVAVSSPAVASKCCLATPIVPAR